MKITLYDTSVGSPNIGDMIIMESVERELADLFPDSFISRLPTHDRIGKYGRRLLDSADLIFAGGTNLLFSHWRKQRQWRMTFLDLQKINKKLVLMGTGWSTYQDPPDWFAARAYRAILSKSFQHSVRDNYSVNQLAAVGITGVLNTGCPTLWRLNAERLGQLATPKAKRVITTLTDYRKDPENDIHMLETLKRHYPSVELWLQGTGDNTYFKSLNVTGVSTIAPSLRAFDHALDRGAVDFVGTRLHAGIRALQKNHRALIVSVDNRATEMGKDFHLPIIERSQISSLDARIEAANPIDIQLPHDRIKSWREQFKTVNGRA
jgi:polysaccharide pyruvyl transferase WcaK-like protein